ncbi:hypothetical protein [Deferrisoma palaeochoriense]
MTGLADSIEERKAKGIDPKGRIRIVFPGEKGPKPLEEWLREKGKEHLIPFFRRIRGN